MCIGGWQEYQTLAAPQAGNIGFAQLQVENVDCKQLSAILGLRVIRVGLKCDVKEGERLLITTRPVDLMI
jgi:hypothetical protein